MNKGGVQFVNNWSFSPMFGPIQKLRINLRLFLLGQVYGLEGLLKDFAKTDLHGKFPFEAGFERALKLFSEAGFCAIGGSGIRWIDPLHRIDSWVEKQIVHAGLKMNFRENNSSKREKILLKLNAHVIHMRSFRETRPVAEKVSAISPSNNRTSLAMFVSA